MKTVAPSIAAPHKAIRPQVEGRGRTRGERGLALLLVILLMVAVTILGGAAALVWTRHYDAVARVEEKAALAQIDRVLRSEVMETTFIPAATNLLAAVAAVAGESEGRVANSRRGLGRVVLEDPGLGLGPLNLDGLPYGQTMTGSAAPRNPRLLVLSSAGSSLPTNLVSGVALTTNQFNNLWSTAQGEVPADWNWNGNPDDLCIQRVDFGDLFVALTLRYYADEPQHCGRYTLDSRESTTNLTALLPYVSGQNPVFSPFVIRGTYLSLYGTNGVLQFRDIIQDNATIYTCRDGVWYRGLGRSGSRVGPAIRHPTPEEFADALAAFLSPEVPLWPDNGGATKSDMEAAIMNFLTVGATDNQGNAMNDAQEALIDAWVEFTGANPNKP